MPICRHAPSSISVAISRATARSTSVGAELGSSGRGWPPPFDDKVDLAHVQAVLDPVHVGNRRVGLDDHDLGARRDGAVPEVRRAEVEEPVRVDRARLDHHDVGRVDEAPVVVRYLAEVARDVVLSAGVAQLAVVAAEVPVEEVEVVTFRIGFEHGTRPKTQASTDVDVAKLTCTFGQRPVERVGLSQHGAVVQPVAGADQRRRVLRRDPLGSFRHHCGRFLRRDLPGGFRHHCHWFPHCRAVAFLLILFTGLEDRWSRTGTRGTR